MIFLFLDVKRKLGFLGKAGYDIFGKSKLYAPRLKWQALEDTVEHYKKSAETYETAFNDIMAAIKSDQNLKRVSKLTGIPRNDFCY